MSYQYKVMVQGVSSGRSLEVRADVLSEMFNGAEVRDLECDGWELFQVNTLNDKYGTNGFILVFRRPLQTTHAD